MHNLPRFFAAALFSTAIALPIALPTPVQAAETITLNFQDADIKAVINTVADLTGKTFIIDPRVKGKVNVISKQPLSRKDVYGAFLSILEVHGFITVQVGQATKIIPAANSKSSPQPVLDKLTTTRDELVTHVLALRYVSAQQLVPILRPILDKSGHLAAYNDSNSLIISDYASNIERLLEIVKRVDQNTEQEIEIISLQHALGSEVVRLVEKLMPRDPKDPTSKISIGVDERSNSVLISGSKGKRLELRTLISHLDTPVESGGNTQVIYLRYGNAENVAKILTGLSDTLSAPPGGGKKASSASRDVHIQADKESNALVITAPQAKFKSLRSVIQKLDIPRAQVHIEAIIAEVSFEAALELGIEWLVEGTTRSSQDLPVAGTSLSGDLASTLSAIAADQIPGLGTGLNLAVGRVTSGSTRFGALLRAMASDTSFNILSTPSLTTLDNQEAEIIVGQNVPFVSGEYTPNTGGGSNPFRTIERQDIGISLKVKPQINEGDAITLAIEQDISSVNSSVEASDLVTNKRTIKTNVLVGNDEIIVLGGLVEDTYDNQDTRVPLLGDIPLLGRLFRYEKTTKVKRNLMVFLHPVIIQDSRHSSNISQSKYTYIQKQQDLANEGDREKMRPELPAFPVKGAAQPEPEPVEEQEDPWESEDDF